MKPWKFFDFVRDNGEDPFQTWYAQQDHAIRAAFDWTIYCRRAMDDWLKPPQKSAKKQFTVFTGKQLGLAELRFWTDDGRKFRAVGRYRDVERDFVLFAGCQEMFRATYYKPRDVMKVAMDDHEAFARGAGSLVERLK